jgi:hypothetical protein
MSEGQNAIGNWCCAELERYIQRAATEPGFGMGAYINLKVGKMFLLLYRLPDSPREKAPDAVRIKFCPWCGAAIEQLRK